MTAHVLAGRFPPRGYVVPGGTTALAQRFGVHPGAVSHWVSGIVGGEGPGRAFQVADDPVLVRKLAARAAFGQWHVGCGCELAELGVVHRLIVRADRVLERGKPGGWLYLSDHLDDVVADDAALAELVRQRPYDRDVHAIWVEEDDRG